MTTKRYRKYLKSKKWQTKRQQVFAYYGKRCYACKKRRRILHVHHLSYANLGNEPMTDLMPLCIDCHKTVTSRYRRNRKHGLRTITMEYVAEMKNLRK